MSAIVNYIDLVPLAEAKLYLRIDDDITESDNEITLMINSACEYIEENTNHILKPKTKSYNFRLWDGFAVNVYDYPIRLVTAPVDENDYRTTNKTLYTRYQAISSGAIVMTLEVGYDDTDDVPSLLKQAVLEIVKNWYYAEDENMGIQNYISNPVMQILAQKRRFIF